MCRSTSAMLGCITPGMASPRAGVAGTAAAPRPDGVTERCGGSKPASTDGPGIVIAALYARVSTEKQDRDDTIASQLDVLQRAAIAGGYEVTPEHVFVD